MVSAGDNDDNGGTVPTPVNDDTAATVTAAETADGDNDDDDELAANIVLLRNDPKLRQHQVANALKYVAAHSWDVEKYQYLGIIDALVAKEPVHASSPAPPEPCVMADSKTNQG